MENKVKHPMRIIESPKNYIYILKPQSQRETKFETFVTNFHFNYILFLYASSFEKKEMLENLQMVSSQNSFFDRFSNWILTLTPSDLQKFKVVLVNSLKSVRYGENFSILSYLCVRPELFPSLKTLVEDEIITKEFIDLRCNYGNNSVFWAKFHDSNEAYEYLIQKGGSIEIKNNFGENLEDFIKNNKI
jgi:ankyrin repeat protein